MRLKKKKSNVFVIDKSKANTYFLAVKMNGSFIKDSWLSS